MSRARGEWRAIPAFLRHIGPELISGASDNDPTNVGTAVAVGAATGYRMAWLTLLVAPLLGVVLTIAGQVGAVAGSDLQTLILKRYGTRVAAILLISVVVVNVTTVAADLQAGAEAIGLLTGVGSGWFVVPLGLTLVGLLILGKYDKIVGVLRYALIGFFAFGVAAALAHPVWGHVLSASLVPTLTSNRDVVAGMELIGTTLTSYVYVWETIGRAAEGAGAISLSSGRVPPPGIGAIISSIFTSVVLWFMLVTSAATLGQKHESGSVTSAAVAASALRPLVGSQATTLFAVGLLVSAVVALPVLVATTGYMVGAQFTWRRGLSEQIREAPRFYGVIMAPIGLAFAVSLANISMIHMLLAASIMGGLVTPVGLVLLVLLARDNTIMGARRISIRLAIAGWVVATIAGGLALLFIFEFALAKG